MRPPIPSYALTRSIDPAPRVLLWYIDVWLLAVRSLMVPLSSVAPVPLIVLGAVAAVTAAQIIASNSVKSTNKAPGFAETFEKYTMQDETDPIKGYRIALYSPIGLGVAPWVLDILFALVAANT
ncbi:hypothetical protein CEP54_014218 [Fusarium duplospermum]|uniref:Uncharacterized protein n=1 Tax=Fusarium duplospermum TaxID=1325734 RepID=A0A428NXI5_9HYPO|nr:hypothetical protein CEP54_014218 [Fusarium duplospermum]